MTGMKSKTGSAQFFKLQALTLNSNRCSGVSNFLLTFHSDCDYAYDYHWHYHYLWHQHRDFHYSIAIHRLRKKNQEQVANYAKYAKLVARQNLQPSVTWSLLCTASIILTLSIIITNGINHPLPCRHHDHFHQQHRQGGYHHHHQNCSHKFKKELKNNHQIVKNQDRTVHTSVNHRAYYQDLTIGSSSFSGQFEHTHSVININSNIG